MPHLLRTTYGRRRLWVSLLNRLKVLIWPLAFTYRRTLIRETKIVAVVGSFGKTTATRAVAAALGLPVARYVGWNSGVFVCFALFRVPPWARHAVVEVGIGKGGQMAGYARLIHPDVTVVTGIGSEHGTSLGTLERTRGEKAAMVRVLPRTGLAILNGDDPNVIWMRDSSCARVVTYGFGARNDLRADDVRSDPDSGTRFALHIDGARHEASTRLVGRHMVYPILAAVAVAGEFGIDASVALFRIEAMPPMPERLELVRTPSGTLLLVDTFKSHLETIYAALEALEDLPAARKLVVLGEVEEPSGSQGPIYRALGRRLAKVAAHVVFVGGRKQLSPLSSGATAAGMPRGALQFAGRSPHKAAELVRQLLQPGDAVLVKGRATQKLLRVAFALEGSIVHCDIPMCSLTPSCARCDRLKEAPRRARTGGSLG